MKVLNVLSPPASSFEVSQNQANYHKKYLEISEVFGAQKLGFHLSVIEPKNFSFPYHYHMAEEELFLVLEGEATLRCNNQFGRVVAGDLFYYGTGPESAHHLYNHTDKPFKMLAMSLNDPEGDQCFYPDSKKQTSPQGILQNGQIVSYFKDEEDPARYWPAEILAGGAPLAATMSCAARS